MAFNFEFGLGWSSRILSSAMEWTYWHLVLLRTPARVSLDIFKVSSSQPEVADISKEFVFSTGAGVTQNSLNCSSYVGHSSSKFLAIIFQILQLCSSVSTILS